MSEEARPMTPTEEEAELAAAIFVSEGFEEDEEIVAAEIALRMRGALKGFAAAPTVRDRYCFQARAILAAGYVRRNDALEEAAKEALRYLAMIRIVRDEPGADTKTADAAIGVFEHLVDSIRALKAKTQGE